MKKSRIAIIIVLDIIFVNLAFLGAIYINSGIRFIDLFIWYILYLSIPVTIVKVITFHFVSLYRSIWEFASVEELIRIVVAVSASMFFDVVFLLANQKFDLGIIIVAFSFEVLLIGGNRFIYRILRRIKYRKSIFHQENVKRILLVGSGSTASLIATEIKTHTGRYGRLVGFIDDDKSKLSQYMGGTKILGTSNDIVRISRLYHIDEIIIAMPTATAKDTKHILEICKLTNAKVTIVPGIVEIIGGKVSIDKARSVKVEDLLGREAVDLHINEVAQYIKDKTVLVTGGGGSIGSELCRQVLRLQPSKLVVVDIYENNAYDLQSELSTKISAGTSLEVYIASVRERDTVFNIIEKHKPDVIFHAAAHKHVPLMEVSPKEAIKNNVIGTLNIAEAAHKFRVEHFVLISSDKAVNPTSVMGASKRLCEMIVQAIAKTSKTIFVAVRFGNVLGSNGSVIPLFERQIKEGGPLTVTHKEVVRYFMTITEASQLVIQAGAFAKGGEIFVLDMGEPVKIYNLALDLIKLSGLKPFEDIDIVLTGLRPGEKLFEELLLAEEGMTCTSHNKIYIAAPQHIDFVELRNRLNTLKETIKKCTDKDVGELLHEFVPEYHPSFKENGVKWQVR